MFFFLLAFLFIESETVWEMAATSLRDDVLLDPEECHERASHCSFAHV